MYRSEQGSTRPNADSNELTLSVGFEQLRAELASAEARGTDAAGAGSTCDTDEPHDFDVVIVGSGYGGAVAAQAFAGRTITGRPARVCVLERGKRYQPVDFPADAAMLPGHIRFDTTAGKAPRGEREGLFDLRIGPDVCTLVANGLGGGSLINAGVMLEPSDDVLTSTDWPATMRDGESLRHYLGRAQALLDGPNGSKPPGAAASIAATLPPAGAALRRLADAFGKGSFSSPPLSIALDRDRHTDAGIMLKRCRRCSDCMTGCRHGSKRSLDTSLLASAARQHARIFTGATVLRLARRTCGTAWLLDVVHTDARLRKRQGDPLRLSARRVVLAAGSFGSTEILMRSRSPQLRFSEMLGERFSTNGDMIAAAWDLRWPDGLGDTVSSARQRKEGGSVVESAREGKSVGEIVDLGVGPTISAMLDLRNEHTQVGRPTGYAGIVVQSLVIPAALRRLYEEAVTTTHALNTLDLEDPDPDPHARTDRVDPCAVSAATVDRTLAVAMMGDDGAAGRLELRADNEGDSAIDVHWQALREHPLFRRQVALLDELIARSGAEGGAIALANPLWSPIREPVASILDVDKGPLMTVHPLGGCRMGNNSADGVVNELGQVFDPSGPDPDSVHDGLVVLDGAIVPRALGINPALTIAALALRACEALTSKWGFDAERTTELPGSFGRELADATGEQGGSPGELADAADQMADPGSSSGDGEGRSAAAETQIELRERMSGVLRLASRDGGSRLYRVELTLSARGATLRELAEPMGRSLTIAPQREPGGPGGLLRVFSPDDWERIEHPLRAAELGRGDDDIEARLEAAALVAVPVSGSIRLLEREASTRWQRRTRALWAWLRNRGLRDARQYFRQLLQPAADTGRGRNRPRSLCVLDRIRMAWRVATRAGEVRCIEYALELGTPRELADLPQTPATGPFEARRARLLGIKRLTYARRSNPWRQLSELEFIEFPALKRDRRIPPERPVISLDTAYLARVQTPLLRIVSQRDQPSALIDLASMALYWFRLLISIHLWSFREPDPPSPDEPQCLPGILPGLPNPSIHSISLDPAPDGEPVEVRLTRYAPVGSSSAHRPVVLIHGYSTSGTCFAHPEVDPNLAGWLWQRGRDVWIVDLRTSSGLPSATRPWRFEDPALIDLPEAFAWIRAQIRSERGRDEKLDVVAHCMGAVMFSMAVLRPPPDTPSDEPDAPPYSPRLARIRSELPGWIGRVVLSQAGPMLAFDRANVFRAYAMRWLRHFLPLSDYRFRVDPPVSQLDRLIDRALATLPYPEHEFDGENPLFRSAPFVTTRHRMDALYGRDFELANMAPEVLDRIDDLFGPLSIETLSQTMHFARHRTITDRAGRAIYASAANIVRRWTFPTLYLHSARSGLFDRTTAALLEARFAVGDAHFVTRSLNELGHQDSLIGRKAERMFAEISAWLDPRSGARQHAQPARNGASDSAPRLSVRPPTFGPVICTTPTPADDLEIRFGTEPAFGPPERLVLVPVSPRQDGGFDRKGASIPLWIEPCGDDWWQTTLMLAPLRKRIEAVLVLIVRGHPAWAGEPSAPMPDFGAIRDEIEAAVDIELREAAATLEPGLLLLGDHPPPDSPAREPQRKGFLLASCQYPAGMIDGHVAEASFRSMLALLDSAGPAMPDTLLLLGDTIYADATAGLFDPVHVDERLSARYRALLAMPPLRKILRRLRVLAMPDDHEIFDNWEPTAARTPTGTDDDSAAARALAESRAAFLAVFGGGDRDRDRGCNRADERRRNGDSPLWFETRVDGHPLFMLDTRTVRSHRDPARIRDATIIDEAQACELESWLLRNAEHTGPRFVASPSMPLPRRPLPASEYPAGALRFDAWDGYPRSLHRLLAFIAEHRLRRLVFISGDEHLSCVARIELESDDGQTLATLHSVHCSALYAPWPFANSRPEDFVARERFEIERRDGDGDGDGDGSEPAKKLWCRVVRTDFVPMGSGFARIAAERKNGNWILNCHFFGGSGEGTAAAQWRYPLDGADA